MEHPSPEFELLVCCLGKRHLDERKAQGRALIHENLDWDLLTQTAIRHRILPLIYRELNQNFPDIVPADQLTKLRDLYEANTVRNTYLTAELCRILDDFDRHGIDSVPYKGPALASLVYNDISLEQFVDLDILVRKQDFAHASDRLIAQGYDPNFKISEADEQAFLRLSYVQLFRRARDRGLVELHWQIAPRFFVQPLLDDAFWKRLRKVNLTGKSVWAPSSEDLLVMLCIHGSKDLWERLKWISGLAEFLATNPDIAWTAVIERAESLGVKRMVLLSLHLANDLLSAPLPETIARQVDADKTIPKLTARVQNLLAGESAGLRKRMAFHLGARERLRDRVRYCFLFATTTTPLDWAILPVPRQLSFVHYFLRPIRLFRKYLLKPDNHAF